MIAKTLSPAARRHLRFVRVPAGPCDLTRFPDFLIIGPQRTGTSWLYRKLRHHPEILWGRHKELHFFNLLDRPSDPRYVGSDIERYLALFDRSLRWWISKHRHCLRSHRRLYRPKVCGEATASYAAMNESFVDEVKLLNSDVKVIIMVRNPIDRAWSHAKKDLVRDPGRELADVSDEEFRSFLSSEPQLRCADYAANIEKWSQRLGAENVYVGRFDDIASTPNRLLADVCEFIGVDGDPQLFDSNDGPVNPTGTEEVPTDYRAFLSDLLAVPLTRLDTQLGLRWE